MVRVLVAEDDVTTRTILQGMLAKWGYDVVPCVDGREAYAVLQGQDAPQLAVLDWEMPGMDGLEVVRLVRARETERPPYIILVTSKGDKIDTITGLEAGADDYLSKPVDMGELRARVGVGKRMLEMQDRMAVQVEELRSALEHIQTLQGILPICSFCKKIRDDQGYWDQVEAYISRHSEAEFSHSVCPECMERHYGGLEGGEGDDGGTG